MNALNLQPTLTGELIELRPLTPDDFENLFSVASDPLIWEQHPAKDRFKREVYSKLFQDFIETKGTLVILDLNTKKIIGSSRYYDYSASSKSVAIGYTMLAREFWGGRYNLELKHLMIEYAFNTVEQIIFHVGEHNLRSQKALEKIGAIRFDPSTRTLPDGKTISQFHYKIERSNAPHAQDEILIK